MEAADRSQAASCGIMRYNIRTLRINLGHKVSEGGQAPNARLPWLMCRDVTLKETAFVPFVASQ